MAFFSFFSSVPSGDEHFNFIVKDVYKERQINGFGTEPQAGSSFVLCFIQTIFITSMLASNLYIIFS